MAATVVMARCGKSGKLYAIRAQQSENGWQLTWAFALDESKAKREGYDKTSVKGQISFSNEFPGCPHCGADAIYQCGKCNKISCYAGTESKVVCKWCGSRLKMTENTNFSEIKGSSF